MGKREELEAKLIDNPQDAELRMVYADLLQSTGDPRGELIVLQAKGSGDAAAYFKKHEDAFLGSLARFAKTFEHEPRDAFTWKDGFIKSAAVGYESYSAGDNDEDHEECTADRVVAALLQHPSAMLLEDLTVTMNMLEDGMYFEPVCKAIAQYRAPALRTLRIGEYQQAGPGGVDNNYDYENSWAGIGDASDLWQAVPRLEALRIQANLGGASVGGNDTIGTFDLPRLRRLEVVTGGLAAKNAQSFARGRLPALEAMDLWFGSDNYGGDAGVGDLEELLAGTRVPKLARLGIMNASFVDELLPVLARSPLLARLSELSFAHGTLGDDGVEAITQHADAFRHLKALDVSNNYLSSDAVAALRKVCPVVSETQRADDDRYVALSE